MKKSFFLAALLVVLGATMVYAQPRAIGARLGYGAEFSYQHGFGDSNMLELEVGVPAFSGLEAAITYDWIDPFGATVPWNEKGEWHWYMGVGGQVATGFNFKSVYLGAAGRFGIEYDFWFPMQLSIDWRPSLGVALAGNGNGGVAAGFGYDLYAGGIGLGIRYKF